MVKPKVYADFHNADANGRLRLNCVGTVEDLRGRGSRCVTECPWPYTRTTWTPRGDSMNCWSMGSYPSRTKNIAGWRPSIGPRSIMPPRSKRHPRIGPGTLRRPRPVRTAEAIRPPDLIAWRPHADALRPDRLCALCVFVVNLLGVTHWRAGMSSRWFWAYSVCFAAAGSVLRRPGPGSADARAVPRRPHRRRLLGAAPAHQPHLHRRGQPAPVRDHRPHQELRRRRRPGEGQARGRAVQRLGRVQGHRGRRLHPGRPARPRTGKAGRRHHRPDRRRPAARTATSTPITPSSSRKIAGRTSSSATNCTAPAT